jgi:hypothetical protein
MMAEEMIRVGDTGPGLRMRTKIIFEREKLIYRKVGKELITTYDEKGVYYEQTVHSAAVTDKNVNVKFILGLFNSTLLKFYYHKTNSQGGDIFPQIRISSVEKLPIKIADKKHQHVIQILVEYILYLKNHQLDSTFFERLIDALVYELYLPEAINAGDAVVLKYLTDLPELSKDDEVKNLKTIEKVSKELSDPKHPISAALLKLLTIDEINIIEGRK